MEIGSYSLDDRLAALSQRMAMDGVPRKLISMTVNLAKEGRTGALREMADQELSSDDPFTYKRQMMAREALEIVSEAS